MSISLEQLKFVFQAFAKLSLKLHLFLPSSCGSGFRRAVSCSISHFAGKKLTAVCERIRQELAQAKIGNSLKLCDLGFSRVLMTMDKLILVIDVSLAPDDVTSKSSLSPEGDERAGGIEKAQRLGRAHAGETRGPKYRPKSDFDVTSSGANETSMTKISLSIVISTLENPKSQSFRELTFLTCDRLILI
ncbi:hypothetical protein PRIPAC_88440 [Pristionchus pacificus]|uniref:Uncharacterized protein n=1 Tax=Pristionchus pacificus TaxID=54126 RepID=A0A2A6CTR0_PRIPA|nr:hypothetical protein PRIPAC_88440 [Pristionchus pacificus]|eukprot:PDM81423.1 hypothetical protein PRIPAC_35299 [Pristionchus pacificus]